MLSIANWTEAARARSWSIGSARVRSERVERRRSGGRSASGWRKAAFGTAARPLGPPRAEGTSLGPAGGLSFSATRSARRRSFKSSRLTSCSRREITRSSFSSIAIIPSLLHREEVAAAGRGPRPPSARGRGYPRRWNGPSLPVSRGSRPPGSRAEPERDRNPRRSARSFRHRRSGVRSWNGRRSPRSRSLARRKRRNGVYPTGGRSDSEGWLGVWTYRGEEPEDTWEEPWRGPARPLKIRRSFESLWEWEGHALLSPNREGSSGRPRRQ